MESKKILLVNEKEEAREIIDRVFQKDSPLVVMAFNQEDAIMQTLNEKFDLVIISTEMPGLNSFLTADFIRKQLNTKNIPVIFTCAKDEDKTHFYNNYENDSMDLIMAPLRPRELKKKITHHLSVHPESLN